MLSTAEILLSFRCVTHLYVLNFIQINKWIVAFRKCWI